MATLRDRLSTRISGLRSPVVAAGLVLGLVGLIGAYLLRTAIPGRLLVDPLPLALLPTSLFRSLREGFVYLDLRSPALHLLLAIGYGFGAAWLTARRGGTGEQARQTARIGAGLGLLVAAVQEIDALIVAFYYGLSAFVSLAISAYVADLAFRRLHRRLANSLPSSTKS